MYTITDGEGRIMFNHDQIVISHSSWRINDQVTKLNGLITLGKEEEYLNLNVVADKVALEAITDMEITRCCWRSCTYWRHHCSALA